MKRILSRQKSVVAGRLRVLSSAPGKGRAPQGRYYGNEARHRSLIKENEDVISCLVSRVTRSPE